MLTKSTWNVPKSLPSLEGCKVIGFDTETFDPELQENGPGFVYDKAHIIGFSLYTDTGYNEYFPIRHKTGVNFEGQWHGWLNELFQRENITVVTANGRYDMEGLWKEGINVKARVADIQVIEALLDENQSSYSLDSIGQRRQLPGKDKGRLEEELVRRGFIGDKGRGKGKPDYTKLAELEPEFIAEYGKYDPKLTYDIFMQQCNEIRDENLAEVVAMECELGPMLLDMRIQGVRTNITLAEQMNDEFKKEGEELLAKFRHIAAMDVNPFSSQQIAVYLDTIGIEVPKTEKDNDSVTNEFLESLEDQGCQFLVQYRAVEKIRRDFIEGMVLTQSYNGRLHPQYYQTRGTSFMSDGDVNGTRSGRIGTVNPNLSQIPKRHPKYGRKVRSLFLPDEGEIWCKADYSQQEPRILLHFAYLLGLDGANELRQIYINDPKVDYHKMMTDRVNTVRAKPITRGQGKDINLGLAYGLGKVKMAGKLKIPQTESNNILLSYHEANPFVRQLQYRCIEVATERGYVKTVLGRRRRFNQWEAVNWTKSRGKTMRDKEAAEKEWGRVRRSMVHKALNSIVQGSAADQMKKAMLALREEGVKMRITLYDETGSSLTDPSQARLVKEVMENAIPFTVPHYVDLQVGDNWGNTEKYE